MSSSAVGAGTTAIPRPAATRVTSVEVSETSCWTRGENPASAQMAKSNPPIIERPCPAWAIRSSPRRSPTCSTSRLRERMFRRQRDEQAVTTQRLGPDGGIVDRRPQQGDVDVTGEQRVQLGRGEHLAANVDLDVRQLVAQGSHQLGEHRIGRRPDAPDRQVPLDADPDAPRLVPGVVHGVENGDCPFEIRLARGRQLNPPSTSGEEADVEFALQEPDLLGQWRLRHVQSLGGLAEVQLLGDGAKVAQMA